MLVKDDPILRFEPLWGDWYVKELLGSGASGRVYRVVKKEQGKEFVSAVKMISIPNEEQYTEIRLSADTEDALKSYIDSIRDNILNEITLLYQLRGNSNIVSYEDFKTVEQEDDYGYTIFIRMEYLETLPNYLSKQRLSRQEVIKLGTDICSAIDTYSSKGIIHRDIKDDNIFVSNSENFKVGDFGIAKQMSSSGEARSRIGTPLYMAPEVFNGEGYDIRADIYSLGIVLYRLLNQGKMPFVPLDKKTITMDDTEMAFHRRLKGDTMPLPSTAGAALGDVILKACAHRPADRYKTGREFRNALLAVANEMSEAEKQEEVTVLQLKKFEKKSETGVPIRDAVEDGVTVAKMDKTGATGHGLPPAATKPKDKNWTGMLKYIALPLALVLVLAVIVWQIILAWPKHPTTNPSTVAQSGSQTDTHANNASNTKNDPGGTAAPSGTSEEAGSSPAPQASQAPLAEAVASQSPDAGTKRPMGDKTSGPGDTAQIPVIASSKPIQQGGGTGSVPPTAVPSGASQTEVKTPAPVYISLGVGNSENWGFVTGKDGFVYYEDKENGGLCKRHIQDDSVHSRLVPDASPCFLNVNSDFVYYSDYRDFYRIYRVKTDGTEKKRLNYENSKCLHIIDGMIYFINDDEGGLIYKMRTDGSGKSRVGSASTSSFSYSNGWLYYIDKDQEGRICRMKTSGAGNQAVSDTVTSDCMVVSGDTIYFRNMDDSGSLYSMKADGSSVTKIASANVGNINAVGSTVYYTNKSDGGSLYAVSGSAKRKVCGGAKNIAVLGDWIFYMNAGDNDRLYRVKSGGSGNGPFE